MSSSLHQKKLEEQRQRQLSRQARRREMMTSSMSNSVIANSEEVEYMHAYDNHGAALGSPSADKSRSKKKDRKSKKRSTPKEISKLIDVSDEDEFSPGLKDLSTNRKLELAVQNDEKQADANNNHTDDGEITPRNTAVSQQNEDLFCISDASSESGNDDMGDDVSIANGVGIRPQTAASNYVRPDTSASTSFDNLPEPSRRPTPSSTASPSSALKPRRLAVAPSLFLRRPPLSASSDYTNKLSRFLFALRRIQQMPSSTTRAATRSLSYPVWR